MFALVASPIYRNLPPKLQTPPTSGVVFVKMHAAIHIVLELADTLNTTLSTWSLLLTQFLDQLCICNCTFNHKR